MLISLAIVSVILLSQGVYAPSPYCYSCSLSKGQTGGLPFGNLPASNIHCNSTNLSGVPRIRCSSFCVTDYLHMDMMGMMNYDVIIRACADEIIKGERTNEPEKCCISQDFNMGGMGTMGGGACICSDSTMCNNITVQNIKDNYAGEVCPNPCSPNPCPAGQECTSPDQGLSYFCGGSRPATAAPGLCHPPCRNGGTCSKYMDWYYCKCLPGWSGADCTSQYVNCYHCTRGVIGNKPALCSDGECVPAKGGYCMSQFAAAGPLSMIQSLCWPTNPFLGGQKIPGCDVIDLNGQVKSKTCVCNTDYCNGCYPNPCINGGSCDSAFVNGKPTIICTCAPGYTGSQCETPNSGTVPPVTGGHQSQQPGASSNSPLRSTKNPTGSSTTNPNQGKGADKQISSLGVLMTFFFAIFVL